MLIGRVPAPLGSSRPASWSRPAQLPDASIVGRAAGLPLKFHAFSLTMWHRAVGSWIVALRLAVASGRDRERIDATARAVIECAADAIIAFGTDRTVTLWNPAAERMFGWKASEVVCLELAFIPEELKAEHNAVLEHVASGGQVSFATRRIRKDGRLLDLRVDNSALVGSTGETAGWVSVCHQTAGDEAVKHYMAERARVVRRLGDVVADMNAQLELSAVLGRNAANPRELTRGGAGVGRDRGRQAAPGQPRRAADPAARPHRRPGVEHRGRADAVRQDRDDGQRRGGPVRRPHLVRAARAAHDHADPLARGGPPVWRAVRAVLQAEGRPRRAGTARTAGRARQRGAVQRHGVRGGRQAAGARTRGD